MSTHSWFGPEEAKFITHSPEHLHHEAGPPGGGAITETLPSIKNSLLPEWKNNSTWIEETQISRS